MSIPDYIIAHFCLLSLIIQKMLNNLLIMNILIYVICKSTFYTLNCRLLNIYSLMYKTYLAPYSGNI